MNARTVAELQERRRVLRALGFVDLLAAGCIPRVASAIAWSRRPR